MCICKHASTTSLSPPSLSIYRSINRSIYLSIYPSIRLSSIRYLSILLFIYHVSDGVCVPSGQKGRGDGVSLLSPPAARFAEGVASVFIPVLALMP